MKALVLKPIMWNTNQYIKPSGYPGKSGFAHDHGYGHEEWNNNPSRVWRDYRVFHTESTEKLLKYSKTGELGILAIASFKGKQYAISIATSVFDNAKDERDIIAEELNTYECWKDVWQVDRVRRCFNNDQQSFLRHWKNNYRWIRWKCPVDQYHHFEDPVPLDPNKISGKTRLTLMHGRFQAVYPEQILGFIESQLSKNPSTLDWLLSSDFEEVLISEELRRFKQSQQGQVPRKRSTSRNGSNSPAIRKYQYWVEGNRSVEPHHARLQAKYVKFLKAKGITPREDANYVDVQYQLNNQIVFAEIKPKTIETKYAIRMAIGQLFEYRYNLNPQAQLEIVLESEPTDEEKNFVASLGMMLTYFNSDRDTFVRVSSR